MLPIILQHVRELAESHVGGVEKGRYKIITPFPPSSPDFPDFEQEALVFSDRPQNTDEAVQDTRRAFEFFKRTDNLYYDYSYGIRSDEYLFSQVCQRFFLEAQIDSEDIDFSTTFGEKSDAFLNKYKRSTIGDLGQDHFRYTSLSPIFWSSNKIKLNEMEVERLKNKAISVYEDLELQNVGFVNSLIEAIRSSNYSDIEYDLGLFDVIREWVDPRLFEPGRWKFGSGSTILYGETDSVFDENNIKLCFAQRFYLIRNQRATEIPKRPGFVWIPATVDVPGHWERERASIPGHNHRFRLRHRLTGTRDSGAASGSAVVVGALPLSFVDFRRRETRNSLIESKIAKLTAHPGLIESTIATEQPSTERAIYKVAAVRCRVLPRKHELT